MRPIYLAMEIACFMLLVIRCAPCSSLPLPEVGVQLFKLWILMDLQLYGHENNHTEIREKVVERKLPDI